MRKLILIVLLLIPAICHCQQRKITIADSSLIMTPGLTDSLSGYIHLADTLVVFNDYDTLPAILIVFDTSGFEYKISSYITFDSCVKDAAGQEHWVGVAGRDTMRYERTIPYLYWLHGYAVMTRPVWEYPDRMSNIPYAIAYLGSDKKKLLKNIIVHDYVLKN